MNSIPTDSRRNFLRLLAFGTASSTLGTSEWFGTLLADVRPVGDDEISQLRLKVSDFPALKNANGSVRIGGSRIVSDFPLGQYPLLITRGANNQFFALNSRCSHEDCAVRSYSASARSYTCPCHNSRYAMDGSVIVGPASFPLTSYKITFDGNDQLVVDLPDYSFAMDAQVVSTGNTPSPRVAVTFYGQPSTSYQVLFRPTMNDSWTVVSFSTTATGTASATTFTGRDAFATVYVDRATEAGFYAVTVKFAVV
ncbi:MAG TPA: Rieske 2Fe-2S domain-containing protein [Verrucomicrobiae bacterium]|nr:Rieske 2Fe-2S domain-containing protein [Verrucomicrobiae bacterium]